MGAMVSKSVSVELAKSGPVTLPVSYEVTSGRDAVIPKSVSVGVSPKSLTGKYSPEEEYSE